MTLREFVDRYGITLAVVTAVTLVLMALPGNAPERAGADLGVGAGGTAAGAFEGGSLGGPGLGAVDGPAVNGDTSAGGLSGAAGSVAAGGSGSAGGGSAGAGGGAGGTGGAGGGSAEALPTNCRSDGRMHGIAQYMPPCVVPFTGDNGGATARGVTRDKITVVRYVAQADPGTKAILSGARLSDDEPIVDRAYRAIFQYGNHHYDTYGREVVLVNYRAGGSSESDEAMKADAVRIAQDIKPFAVMNGDPAFPLPNILARELSARGVLCFCTESLTAEYYAENPLAIPSGLPTISEYAANAAEFIGKRMGRKPAKWAGDLNPQLREQPRKYGLIYLEGQRGRVDPEGRRARDTIVREMAKYGLDFEVTIGYIYDPGRNQQDVTNLIAQLKSAGVTTVIPLWDPLYPILITQEASRQQYFPEWFIVGTGLSDTTTGGRLYDQQQWRNAFGSSPLWVTWANVNKSEGYREFHHGLPGMQPGDEGVLVNIYRARIQHFFIGLHMAGPRLTNETMLAGLFRYPRTGGTPKAPLVFSTRQYPSQIKDFTEVWWSADTRGPDERGEQAAGMMMKVDGGKRYLTGQWPTSEPKAFVMAGTATVSDDPKLGGPLPHEEDGHRHEGRCLSCAS